MDPVMRARSAAALFFLLVAAGCGQKGPLYLPGDPNEGRILIPSPGNDESEPAEREDERTDASDDDETAEREDERTDASDDDEKYDERQQKQ
jgi:predicted small lipoprotein YifL